MISPRPGRFFSWAETGLTEDSSHELQSMAVYLCGAILDPLREITGSLVVTRWHSTPEHNKEVGGVEGSQHLLAAAADLLPQTNLNGTSSAGLIDSLAKTLRNGRANFDQIIGYEGSPHIHVSVRQPWDKRNNRHEILIKRSSGHGYREAGLANT